MLVDRARDLCRLKRQKTGDRMIPYCLAWDIQSFCIQRQSSIACSRLLEKTNAMPFEFNWQFKSKIVVAVVLIVPFSWM